jgi:hypothetical protein
MEPIPDDIRLLNILGAEYYMPWEAMTVGSSVFLPTTALDRQVAKRLRRVERYLDWGFVVRQRCEFGIFGVRIWRVY